MGEKKIVYIAGYSRSGSTILDIILGSHESMFSTGELAYLFDDWLLVERTCTCGKTYSNCSFWKNFKLPEEITFNEAKSIIRQIEDRSSLSMLINNKFPTHVIRKYSLIQTALYNYIFNTAQKKIIVDSSKTSKHMAGRFYALHKYTDFDVYVIHLAKNGLSVVESYVKKGRNWALEGYAKNDRFAAARSSLGWYLANSIAGRLGMKMPQKHFKQIKYEDFVAEPENVLQTIENFLNIDLSAITTMVKNKAPFYAKHNVGGNRLRLEREIRLHKSADAKKIDLSVSHRFIFNLIAGRLHKRLGY